MRFTPAFTALAVALVAGVSATPVPEKDWKYGVGWDGSILDPLAIGTPAPTSPNAIRSSLVPRTPGGLFLCTDINWGGSCGYAVQPLDVCLLLVGIWYRGVGSFGPDQGTTCFAYSQNQGQNTCDDSVQWVFNFPGDPTGGLGTTNSWFHKITTFICE